MQWLLENKKKKKQKQQNKHFFPPEVFVVHVSLNKIEISQPQLQIIWDKHWCKGGQFWEMVLTVFLCKNMPESLVKICTLDENC